MPADPYRLVFFPAPADGTDPEPAGREFARTLEAGEDLPPSGADHAARRKTIQGLLTTLQPVIPGADAQGPDMDDEPDGPLGSIEHDHLMVDLAAAASELRIDWDDPQQALNSAQLLAIATGFGLQGFDHTYDPQLGRLVRFPVDVPAVEEAWWAPHGGQERATAGDATDRASAAEAAVTAPARAVEGIPGSSAASGEATAEPSVSSASAALGRPPRKGFLSRLFGRS